MTLSDKLTIVIPTSPIPSHPSAAIILDTISKLRSYPELIDCRILVMADGVRSEQMDRLDDYRAYLSCLKAYAAACDNRIRLIEFPDHQHQGNTLRATLPEIHTPLLFYVEHDTWPTGEIDFRGICRVVENGGAVHCVRLHIMHEIHPEHQYLMLDKVPVVVDGVPMLRTFQWSQRPHIAKTEWYRWIISNHFTVASRTMIEDRMYGIVVEDVKNNHDNWNKYGLWIYAPPGNIYRSGHNNGRGKDPKFEMRFV